MKSLTSLKRLNHSNAIDFDKVQSPNGILGIENVSHNISQPQTLHKILQYAPEISIPIFCPIPGARFASMNPKLCDVYDTL